MRKLLMACLAVALVATGASASVEKLQLDQGQGDNFQVGMAAPAASQILEDFEGGTPPANWTVEDLFGVPWSTAAFWGMTNGTNGSGECASCDSDAAGSGAAGLDTSLVTPSYDFCGATNSGLNVQLNYQNYA